MRDLFRYLAGRNRRVRFAVGDVRAELAALDLDGFAAHGIGLEFFDARRRTRPVFGLREQFEGLFKSHLKDGLLVLERTRVCPLLEIRAIGAVLRRDGLVRFRVDSHDAR
ncbi:unannotated protein [freshwater metagenome]|uniref:Unannotated protein n=1 Tax=freshwater metagenome TaxID=449393 RepID=A0A6J7DMC5_9ZZZZ